MTPRELAKRLRVNLTTIKDWREAGCPHQRKGRRIVFHPPAVQQWLIATGRATRTDNGGSQVGLTGYDKAQAELRELQLKAEERQLRVMKLRHELLPTALVISTIDDLVSRASAHLDEVPEMIAVAANLSGQERISAIDAAERVIRTCRISLRSLVSELSEAGGQDSVNSPEGGNGTGPTPGESP